MAVRVTAARWLWLLAIIGALLIFAGAWFLLTPLRLFGVALMVPLLLVLGFTYARKMQ